MKVKFHQVCMTYFLHTTEMQYNHLVYKKDYYYLSPNIKEL